MTATTLLRRLTRRCRACGHRFEDHEFVPYGKRGACRICICRNWER